MNKKAQSGIFIIIVAAAFLFSIALYYGGLGESQPGGASLYLGENEIELFETYFQAEKDIYYIELAAGISLDNADKNNLEESFKENFAKYLEKTEMTIEDYSFTFSSEGEEVTVLAKTEKTLDYDEGVYLYKITPSFRATSLGIVEDSEEERQSFV
tara:strand:+ start:681 stop:1148 length:468 start_codon:yes stop_codon:yes gene_type:complete